MYSPQIISKNLQIVEARGGEGGTPLSFRLHRYSLEEVRSRTAHLNSLIDQDLWRQKRQIEFLDSGREQDRKQGRSPLGKDEAEWVRNEQLLCTFDYLYFATRYAHILYHDHRGLDLYRPNKAQLILNDIRASIEEKGVGIFLLQLKARQMGVTTDDAVCESHRVIFHRNTRALTASSKEDKTWEIAEKVKLIINNVPWFLLPREWRLYDSGQVLFDSPSMNTRIRLQFGNQTGGIGRGETPTFAHITEIPDWLNPKEDIQSALLKSMHNDPWLFFVAESTAKYDDDYWAALWDEASTYYHQGKSRLYPVFFPWYLADDIYPTPADVRAYMPSDYSPSPEALHHAEKAEQWVRSNPLAQKYLGREWKMPPRQMWFWEWDKEQARREGRLAEWYSEMPATAEEAFRVKGSGIFDAEFIADLRERATPPLCTFGLMEEKEAIPFRYQFFSSLDLDEELPVIPVEARWSDNSLYHHSYKLIPLRTPNLDWKALAGRILIWEMPDEDEDYYLAEDCGEGIGQDYTYICVWRKGDWLKDTRDRIVACFYSNQISAKASFHFIFCLGSFYRVARSNRWEQPQLVIERPKGGAALIQELIQAGWKNFYSSREVGSKPKDPSDKLGWDPSQGQALRDSMLGEFLTALRDREVDVDCQFLISALASFGVTKSGKLAALAGKKDDPIMAAGIGYFAMNIFSFRGKGETAEKRRRAREEKLLAERMKREYTMGDMAKPVAAKTPLSYSPYR